MIWYFIVSQRSFNGALAKVANVKLSQVKQNELNRFVLVFCCCFFFLKNVPLLIAAIWQRTVRRAIL